MRITVLFTMMVMLAVTVLFYCNKDETPSEIPSFDETGLPVRFGLPKEDGGTLSVASLDEDGDGQTDGIDLTEDEIIDMYYVYDSKGEIIGLDEDEDGQVDYYATYDSESETMNLSTQPGGKGTPVKVLVDDTGKVTGMDSDGDGEVDVVIKDETPPTTEVSNPETTVTDGQPVISWTNPDTADFDHVVIVRKEGAEPVDMDDGTQVYTGSDESYTDDESLTGTSYFYVIFTCDAYDNCMSTGESVSVSFCPGIPTGVDATDAAHTDKVVVTWTAVDFAEGYKIYRSTSASSGYTELGTSSTGTYTDTTGTPGTSYYYKVSATKTGCTESAQSASDTGLILACPSSAPTGLSASDGLFDSKVSLSWSSVTNADGYKIYRSESAGSGYTSIGTSSLTTYDDSSAVLGTKYYYKVSGTGTGGCVETSQSDYAEGYSAPSIDYGDSHPGTSGNAMVTVPETTGYPEATSSEFYLGGTGGPNEVQVAMAEFDMNPYEVTNIEYQKNFYDMDGDGDLTETTAGECSAYFHSDCVGPSGLTAQEAWELALDVNEDGTYPDRSVTIDNANGVSLGVDGGGLDDDSGSTYTNIKGPGTASGSYALGNPTVNCWPSASDGTQPWDVHCGYSGYEYDVVSNDPYKPVIYVSWYESRAYCKYVYGESGDLPTEAEYERAAKGTTSGAYQYPWGMTTPASNCSVGPGGCDYADWDCSANDIGCHGKGTSLVGAHPQGMTGWSGNPGIYDLSGNVWERTNTWYVSGSDYATLYGGEWQTSNPTKREKGSSTYRVVRGGSWSHATTNLQSAYRYYYDPRHRTFNSGFRCVLRR